MSSQLRDLSADADVYDMSREAGERACRRVEHPRAAGFRVLSRLARRVDEASQYEPRHRLAGADEPEAVSVAG
jgi:hypothetical protein